ncbi:unannotated protein [freshwater metagenome]|uniref:Unannotated protein n=1 Tax=freshwater metagenome TaxID=449393 RepID=A0A6J6SWE7_9ZZZZ
MWRMMIIGAIPIARSATTAVEVNRSRVPSPVKKRGLMMPVIPIVTIRIKPRLPSRPLGFKRDKKFTVRHPCFR